MAFVDAYNTVTGEKQVIPEHWLSESHPAFTQFSTTPGPKARGAAPATNTKPAKPENEEAK